MAMCPRPEYAKTNPERWRLTKLRRKERWDAMGRRLVELMESGMDRTTAFNTMEDEVMAGNPPWNEAELSWTS